MDRVGPTCRRFVRYYRNRVFRALFHALPENRLVRDSQTRLLREAISASGGPSSTSRLPAVYLAGDDAGQRLYVPGRSWPTAGAAGRGYARRHRRPAGLGPPQVHVQTARPGRHRLPSRPRRSRGPRVTRRWARSPRWCRGRRRRPGRVRGGGGEPVGAGLVGDHLRDAEADELVQGVGDRAGRPGEHLADLVRGEGGAGELAQVVLDQVAQRAGPGGGGAPAAGGGLDDPPPLGGLLPGGLQGGQGGGQVPGGEGLPGLVGGLGDGQDGPGGLGGDRRVRLRPGAGCPAAAVRQGGLPAGAARRRAARRCRPRRGPRRAGPRRAGAAGAAAGFQVSAMPGRLPLTRVAVPVFSCASRACRAAATLIPAWAGDAPRRPRLAGSADSAARTAAAGLWPAAGATGAGAGVRRRVGGAAGRVRGGGSWCVPWW